ncbi:unnamed protein product [Leptidea sinapis]|uniref:THAP-type domain-containing protein n=1 Tax=Leptidea sinapis TaxID=189913 RepID=A0A5E4QX23_9NEOP|nr:unnamed protein product [Leptidea sinapis]
MSNKVIKCAKCGIKSTEDPSLTFHRFPRPTTLGNLKLKVWAKYVFPNEDWTSEKKLKRLYTRHIMICGKHFEDSSFTFNKKLKLHKFSYPKGGQNIYDELRHNIRNIEKVQDVPEQKSSVYIACCLNRSVECVW